MPLNRKEAAKFVKKYPTIPKSSTHRWLELTIAMGLPLYRKREVKSFGAYYEKLHNIQAPAYHKNKKQKTNNTPQQYPTVIPPCTERGQCFSFRLEKPTPTYVIPQVSHKPILGGYSGVFSNEPLPHAAINSTQSHTQVPMQYYPPIMHALLPFPTFHNPMFYAPTPNSQPFVFPFTQGYPYYGAPQVHHTENNMNLNVDNWFSDEFNSTPPASLFDLTEVTASAPSNPAMPSAPLTPFVSQSVSCAPMSPITQFVDNTELSHDKLTQIVQIAVEGNQISSGKAGAVYRVEFEDQNLAVKVFNLDYASRVEVEYDFLRQLSHPNIIKCFGKTEIDGYDPKKKETIRQGVLVLEYCSSTLFSAIEKVEASETSRQHLEKKRNHIALSVAKALQYLHSQGIAHCDISPKNILLTKDYEPKIIDLEAAKTMEGGLFYATARGTTFWQPPEYITAKNDKHCILASSAVDVYAFGIILWQLSHMKVAPYEDKTVERQLNNRIRNGTERPKINNPLWADLIQRCWQDNPLMRPKFNAIVEELEKQSA